VLRANVLANLAMALYFRSTRERRAELTTLAVEMAKRLGDPATLGYALNSRHVALWSPANFEERIEIADEIVRLGEEAGDAALTLTGRGWRIAGLLELGDWTAVELEIEAYTRLAAETRLPRFLWLVGVWDAMRRLLRGPFDEEAEALIARALALGQKANDADALQTFGAQMLFLRKEQKRIAEMEGGVRMYVDQYPTIRTWRCALAYLYALDGRPAEARAALTPVIDQGFRSIPHDLYLVTALALSAHTLFVLEDRENAAVVYDLLLPFEGQIVTVGYGVVISFGSVAHYLGLLATTLERFDEASRHFAEALAAHTRIGALPLAAHTQHADARMLVERGGPEDSRKALELVNRALATAQELGMRALADDSLALKLEAQGVASSDTKHSIYTVASAVQQRRPDLTPHASPDGTVTLMFSDMVGFTEMTERLGDLKAHEVVQAHNAIVREQTLAHGGHELELRGDGFLLAFTGARQAVLCAIDIQRAVAVHNARDLAQPVHVRIGLHTGEAIRDADKFFGKTVIQAFRIADLANGGEILVSALLKQLIESAGDLRFDDGREVELKGISGTQRVFSVNWEF
jgi:class 3 adenylate cyclase